MPWHVTIAIVKVEFLCILVNDILPWQCNGDNRSAQIADGSSEAASRPA